MANSVGRAIIALEGAVAQIPFENDTERDDFLDQLSASLPKRLGQSYKTWKNNRMVKEREDANKPVPKPADSPPDRLQKHKEEFAKQQAERKTV